MLVSCGPVVLNIFGQLCRPLICFKNTKVLWLSFVVLWSLIFLDSLVKNISAHASKLWSCGPKYFWTVLKVTSLHIQISSGPVVLNILGHLWRMFFSLKTPNIIFVCCGPVVLHTFGQLCRHLTCFNIIKVFHLLSVVLWSEIFLDNLVMNLSTHSTKLRPCGHVVLNIFRQVWTQLICFNTLSFSFVICGLVVLNIFEQLIRVGNWFVSTTSK